MVLRPAVAAFGSADPFAGRGIGGACGGAANRLRSCKSDLKWPNDLLIEGKKFCGILTEMNAEATRVRYVVIGIGINVNQTEFPGGFARDCHLVAYGQRQRRGRGWNCARLC